MRIIHDIKTHLVLLVVLLFSAGCEDWLDPKPLSFYTPENAFQDYSGLKTGTDMLNRDVRYLEFYPTSLSADPAYLSELFFSDIAVNGRVDDARSPQDLIRQITPSANLRSGTNMARCHFYWEALYKGIKDANTIISRSEFAEFDSEEHKKEVLALAYFHRAYRYYRLVHQFGDVPFIAEEVTEPRYDFYTTRREVILKQLKADLDLTASFLPEKVNAGMVSQGAAYHLLTKINLALSEFDDAVKSASAVIDGGVHALMKSRFGNASGYDDPTKNVIWDLHQTENKASAANTEALYVVIDRYDDESATPVGLEIKRQVLPWYSYPGQLKTPAGENGFTDNNEIKNPYLAEYGRGIGTLRSTMYHQKQIWKLDDTDLRHDRKSGNWMHVEELKYNNPSLEGKSEWYGKTIKEALEAVDGDITRICSDSIRGWVGWPNYKVNVPDQKTASWRGGNADWYIFRLAETYLLRAEAYIWLGQKDKAMADLNEIRERAGARPLAMSEVTIRQLIDERARELFYEEPRKTELTRISYIYGETGITADNGATYSMTDFSEKNFFFDHISAVTDFYNKGVSSSIGNEYTMGAWHVLWPISESAISVNVQGHINQNVGYTGYETNVEPIDHAN
ncbi:RagB/SusD family nutrient uptake outer membrane protein [Sunxiuqinia elliptica]|uniref:Putative outer membrane starch-binding protein n=1 Tax=Sunxiuqinia elliptica TaxID=655355 RepID=A0A4R6GSQ3_9BACT|nr:RagB/SusD family nutrient uptake outer membrane protein [Sunxiuqinia elliptica]TDN98409.1 putative outer membrane starch-binding protein [Sunxiuqinia elliptica]TDO60512.1 putative outer membrane starch-binding protein [Sunxiuqinia elliptica]